eukprot:scaffold3910_cov537-Prasinococcus_capsulatus_cf.AAC.6
MMMMRPAYKHGPGPHAPSRGGGGEGGGGCCSGGRGGAALLLLARLWRGHWGSSTGRSGDPEHLGEAVGMNPGVRGWDAAAAVPS